MQPSESILQNTGNDNNSCGMKSKQIKPSSQTNVGVVLPDLKTSSKSRRIENAKKPTDPTLSSQGSNVTNLIKQED